MLDRRSFLAGLSAAAALPARAAVSLVRDSAGRMVPIPETVARIFPAGPPASIVVYTLAPEALLGWPRGERPEEREFLLPDVGARPELGRLTGRGNTANLEVVLGLKPDLIIDIGTIADTYVSLADRVQGQTGIPYALLDGRFAADRLDLSHPRRPHRPHAKGPRTLAALCERHGRDGPRPHRRDPGRASDRGSTTPAGRAASRRASRGSINVETLEFSAPAMSPARSAAGCRRCPWNRCWPGRPRSSSRSTATSRRPSAANSLWASVPAVRDGRVHLSPKLPFGWVDFPPSVNRMVGLWWLAKILYPERFPEDIRPIARDFYARFYHVTPTAEQLDRVLAGRG